MPKKPAVVSPRFASELDDIAALWIARLSLSQSGALHQLNESMFADEMRELIGIEPTDAKLPKTVLRNLLQTQLPSLESAPRFSRSVLNRNVGMLGELLKLSSVERSILSFVAISEQHPLLSEMLDALRKTNLDALSQIFGSALDVHHTTIRHALRSESYLMASRLLIVEHGRGRGISLELPSSFRTTLFAEADNLQTLMSAFLKLADPPTLRSTDFAHLKDEITLLTHYLACMVGQQRKGCNVLIYGVPGTGKTQFVRWLASKLNLALYEVNAKDSDGDPFGGPARLAFYQMSQAFLQKSQSLMLFDEIEDIFPEKPSFFGFGERRQMAGKLSINQILESNCVPSIWVSNAVEHIDPAYLRRFDYSFEMKVPPRSARRRILDRHFKNCQVKPETLNYLAVQTELSPAQIEKAAKVASAFADHPRKHDALIRQVIDQSMELLNQSIEEVPGVDHAHYRLDCLNADCDLQELVAQMKGRANIDASMCFYGPPGTGKSALARYLADTLELPLMAKRASDIVSPYLGITERRMADMFKAAQAEGALLLLDEADSFLGDRRHARQSWEISAVNEMLTQMEAFTGLFICSTNLMERLDAASLRRFSLKIKFDYLRPEQRWSLFTEHIQGKSLQQEDHYRQALNSLNTLTPGDFATVRRQAKLLGLTLTPDVLLQKLGQEVKAKGPQHRPMGFTAS